jgi:probable O-glycosylation ligase (exosortase A-associated)
MRDILLTAIIVSLLPICFVRPWVGILVWSWLGYMNPHRFTWSFANSRIPWAEMVAIATICGFVLTRDRKRFIWSRETVLMLLLWGWFTITTMASWYPRDAWPRWEMVSKILLMNFMTIPLIQSRDRLRWLLLVIAGSLGFYGFKGGMFVIATGGQHMVMGAPGRSFVSGNTTIALALNMCLPLFWYLRKGESRPWLRSLLLATFCLSVLAVLFTYSRGGLLGLGCVLAILGARSKRRYLALPLVGLTALVVFTVAPQRWVERMQTIETYDQDQSAMGRLMAWRVGYEIANDRPIFGGGFEVFNQRATYLKYAPQFDHFIDAHSIYFNLLGEHGYVGLGLFVLLILCSLASLLSTYRAGLQREELAWASDFAHMLGAGIVAYLVTGAFLSVAYFDLGWHFLAFVVILKALTAQELETLGLATATAQVSAYPARQPVLRRLGPSQ